MSKDTEIKFVGLPIFKQVIRVISLIDAISLTSLVKKHHADHYYKAYKVKNTADYDVFRYTEPVRFDDRAM